MSALPRTPEPELMDTPDQVAAYASADFAESNQGFVDFFCAHNQPRPTGGSLIDLGCGPGDICIRLAGALPDWRLDGADAGPNMLERARYNIDQAGQASRIRLIQARLPDTSALDTGYDATTSNSLLHHLPDPDWLWQAVRALTRPGGWIQVMDLCRPESPEEIEELVARYAGDEPEVLRQDFANSLHAAWRVDEVQQQLEAAGLGLDCRTVSDRHWMVSGFHPEG